MTYQQPQPQPYTAPPSNGQAVAGMVLGIVAALIGVWSFIPLLGIGAAITAFLPALLAVIFGHGGASRAYMLNGYGRAQARAALWLGYGTFAFIGLVTLFWIVAAIANR